VQEKLIKYFCAGVTARAAAEVSGVNRNTAILFYHKLDTRNNHDFRAAIGLVAGIAVKGVT
jgi:transposase-like protein